MWYSAPSTEAATPFPVIARKPSAAGISISRSSALFTMPRAMGCSDSASTPAAMRSASSLEVPSATARSTTRNSPRVSVPVLSKITASRLRASSSPRRSRTRSPAWAPLLVEMATTSGTASPKACGQAMTSTVTTRTMEKSIGAPISCQTTSVRIPARRATPVSSWAARSARCWARDFDSCASETSRMMPESLVSSPVPVTSTRSDPSPFMVPAMTSSPSSLRTGRDSPVIIASLTSLRPLRMRPSTGTLSPGRTSTTSPSRSSSTVTSSSPPSVMRVAVSGSSLASSWRAPWAWEMERISIQCPSSMMVTRVASSHQSASAWMSSSCTTQEKTKATVMAREMRVIIPGSRSFSSRAAPWRKTQPP
jgi:hypothetical protein